MIQICCDNCGGSLLPEQKSLRIGVLTCRYCGSIQKFGPKQEWNEKIEEARNNIRVKKVPNGELHIRAKAAGNAINAREAIVGFTISFSLLFTFYFYDQGMLIPVKNYFSLGFVITFLIFSSHFGLPYILSHSMRRLRRLRRLRRPSLVQ